MLERPKSYTTTSNLTFNDKISKSSLLRLLETPIVRSMIARAAMQVKEERERKEREKNA